VGDATSRRSDPSQMGFRLPSPCTRQMTIEQGEGIQIYFDLFEWGGGDIQPLHLPRRYTWPPNNALVQGLIE
jgi:hypothetical protein